MALVLESVPSFIRYVILSYSSQCSVFDLVLFVTSFRLRPSLIAFIFMLLFLLGFVSSLANRVLLSHTHSYRYRTNKLTLKEIVQSIEELEEAW